MEKQAKEYAAQQKEIERLKTLVNELPALGGSFKYGFQIEYGYFDQHMEQYTGSKTVLDDFWDEFPALTQNEVRSALGAFYFQGKKC